MKRFHSTLGCIAVLAMVSTALIAQTAPDRRSVESPSDTAVQNAAPFKQTDLRDLRAKEPPSKEWIDLDSLVRVVAKSLPDPFGYSGDAADCVVSCSVELDRCMAGCDADDAACNRSCTGAFGSCREGCRNVGYSATCLYISIGRIFVLDCN